MQEPLLRVHISDSAVNKDQWLRTTSGNRWTYLYSFYLFAFLYILTVCAFSIAHITFTISMFNFYVEDVGLIVVQALIVFVAFFPLWALFSLLTLPIWLKLKKSRGTDNAPTQGKDITSRLIHIYFFTASGLTGTMIVIDLLLYHWRGISPIIGVFFLFLCVLYGPMLLHKIWPRARHVGISPVKLTANFPKEQRTKGQ